LNRFFTSTLFLLAACAGDSNDGGDASADAKRDVTFLDSSIDTGPPWDGGLPVSCPVISIPDASSDAADAEPSDAGAPADAAVTSFANDVTPLFTSCGAGEFCHASNGDAGAFPYDQLVNYNVDREMCSGAGVRVFPSDLHKSYLINKLIGLGMCTGTDQMPMTGDPFTLDQVQTVANWICEGAANN
jgi:hypothetical protein